MAEYPWFPMFVNLSDRRALVVGGGNIAARRARTLSRFCDRVAVVAPEVRPEIEAIDSVEILRRAFAPGDLDGVDIAVAATNDPELNAGVARLCRARGIPVNVASDHGLCDFYFPGVAVDGPVCIGVTASGADHRRAARVTRAAQAMLNAMETEA